MFSMDEKCNQRRTWPSLKYGEWFYGGDKGESRQREQSRVEGAGRLNQTMRGARGRRGREERVREEPQVLSETCPGFEPRKCLDCFRRLSLRSRDSMSSSFYS